MFDVSLTRFSTVSARSFSHLLVGSLLGRVMAVFFALAFALSLLLSSALFFADSHAFADSQDSLPVGHPPLSEHAKKAYKEVSFNRDIRPILVKNCFACHGDASELQGNVMLKTFADATGESGFEKAIIPGDAANSLLIKRVKSSDEHLRMPPLESKKTLTAEQISKLEQWINNGAEYQQHWAYISPQRPAVPEVKNQQWVNNPIDAFVLQKLENKGIEPSQTANGKTLSRRLHMDLWGLYPDYQQVLQHQTIDTDRASYAALVEALMADQHYGERMALPWLDWVKYSDEISNRGNYFTPFYPYRNYVIDAFNQNKPFNDFTIEQLAGDLLPNATDEQIIASGYNQLIVRIQDGVGFEAIHKYITDRVNKIGQIWLGTSFECAQCHDHKFDPVLQKDYYQIGSFFSDFDRVGVWSSGVSGDSTEPLNPDSYFKWPHHYMPTEAQQTRLLEIENELAELHEKVEQRLETIDIDESIERELLAAENFQPISVDREGQTETEKENALKANDYFHWVDAKISKAVVINRPNSDSPQSTATVTPLRISHERTVGGNQAIAARHINYVYADEVPEEQLGEEYQLAMQLEHDTVNAVQVKFASTARNTAYKTLSLSEKGAPLQLEELELWLVKSDEQGLPTGERERLEVASLEATDLSLQDETKLVDGDRSTVYQLDETDVASPFRYEREDDMLLKSIHSEAFFTLFLAQPLLNNSGNHIEVVIKHQDKAALARQVNISYTPLEAASPFQRVLQGPISSNSVMRTIRQWIYNFMAWLFGSEWWDFTAQRIFSWVAVKSGISSPVPFNDVMKSTLATIREMFSWQEIYEKHYVLRHPEVRDLGKQIRDLEREQEKIWSEVERSWVSRTADSRWPVRVLLRGEPTDTTGPLADRLLPGFLVENEGARADGKELTRLDLGRWLVSEQNPLTARVIVNRYWKLFMGEGLVKTVEDFGSGGERPSHPELLDWLAVEFMESGWDSKHIVSLIVNSSTYKQQSSNREDLLKIDPQNHLYARQNKRQLEAEFIQDNFLKVAGLLKTEPVHKHTVHGAEDNPWSDHQYGRSIYLLRKNIDVPAQFKVFGAKPRAAAVIERPESITPLQALAGLNQPLVFRVATTLNEQLFSGDFASDEDKLRHLYQLVLSREPSDQEIALNQQAKQEFYQAVKTRDSADAEKAFWLSQVRAVINVREAFTKV